MLLTISTTHRPATDLGFLLHKNPERLHEKELAFGRALAFFPEAGEERATFALTVDIDRVQLVRGKGDGEGLLDQYVNDRAYAASSFLSVALGKVLNTAMAGRSKHRPDLTDTRLPLVVTVEPIAARGRDGMAARLFEPLGYQVRAQPHMLDLQRLDWGASPYVTLRLEGMLTVREMLTHLYVLIPVLDNSKHFYVNADEVENLLAKGAGWLDGHPEKEFIVNRALRRKPGLVREALARLSETAASDEEFAPEIKNAGEETLETPIRLNDQRMETVTAALLASGAKRVVDLGCGEGRLLRELKDHRQFEEIVGVDASLHSLERAEKRLKFERMAERQRARFKLLHGALTYRDRRLAGYDAAALVEVIEHIDVDRLPALERAVFEFMAPPMVLVTTPNREYNALFEGMAPGAMRHRDHRFEWSRVEFEGWATAVAAVHGYAVRFQPIGPVDDALGAPTQMAVFTRGAST
ncbi:3' terminal RNA ribose 2'-O-methyltransferase Hen1 [Hypericibacter sp.]|uniref:3' terminal RNA ribose 2'-O-methyltransferase Hen1 n=1 Tax=Hypericibacter sp. TaxID=2705401 RepID=UPI003D6CE173